MSIFPAKVLLAVDGSPESDLATAVAADLAEKLASELHVLSVVQLPTIYPTREPVVLDQEAALRLGGGLQEETREMLEQRVTRIGEAGVEAAGSYVRVGRPDEEIVGLAEELGAGLIVIGSRGFSPLKRALLGSVSDSVVRHAHCPVLVVRE